MSETKPLVSIITVVYNGEKYLEQTIQSVINQTYDNLEYIIIDGGSTDGTLDIIKKFDDKIAYWISERDEGIYDAMNKGIKKASGQWINFMNAGDKFFSADVLENVVNHLTANLVYGNHAVYSDDPSIYTISYVKNYSDTRNIPFCHQSLFASTDLLNQTPFDLKYKIAGDYDQYIRCKSKGATIKHIPITVALYLDGGISSISRGKLIKEYYEITKKYFPFNATVIYWIRWLKLKILGR